MNSWRPLPELDSEQRELLLKCGDRHRSVIAGEEYTDCIAEGLLEHELIEAAGALLKPTERGFRLIDLIIAERESDDDDYAPDWRHRNRRGASEYWRESTINRRQQGI